MSGGLSGPRSPKAHAPAGKVHRQHLQDMRLYLDWMRIRKLEDPPPRTSNLLARDEDDDDLEDLEPTVLEKSACGCRVVVDRTFESLGEPCSRHLRALVAE